MGHSRGQSLWSGRYVGGHRPAMLPTQRLAYADPASPQPETSRRFILNGLSEVGSSIRSSRIASGANMAISSMIEIATGIIRKWEYPTTIPGGMGTIRFAFETTHTLSAFRSSATTHNPLTSAQSRLTATQRLYRTRSPSVSTSADLVTPVIMKCAPTMTLAPIAQMPASYTSANTPNKMRDAPPPIVMH